MKKVSLFEIFKIFTVIGIQLLGGGYVIVPLLKKYLVEERNWMSEEELTDYFAMSQCIPGIIAGNISVLAGYRVRKIPGAFAAISGIVFPAFVSILLLAHILKEILYVEQVQNAFWGIRIAVILLIVLTVKELWSKSVNSIFTYILFFTVLAAFLFLNISPVLIILITSVVSLIYAKMKRKADV